MTRILEHTAAAITAILLVTVSFGTVTAVPVESAAYAAAPVLA